MTKLIAILAFFPFLSHAQVVTCESEVWNPTTCSPLIQSFQEDPYPYLAHTTKTLSAAKVAIVSGANRGLVTTWNKKFWDVIGRAEELSGFIQAQREDPRRVFVKDPSSQQILEVSVFAGCYFLRDSVVSEHIAVCKSFLAPAARMFYLGMRAYTGLCGTSEDARSCEALAEFYTSCPAPPPLRNR